MKQFEVVAEIQPKYRSKIQDTSTRVSGPFNSHDMASQFAIAIAKTGQCNHAIIRPAGETAHDRLMALADHFTVAELVTVVYQMCIDQAGDKPTTDPQVAHLYAVADAIADLAENHIQFNVDEAAMALSAEKLQKDEEVKDEIDG